MRSLVSARDRLSTFLSSRRFDKIGFASELRTPVGVHFEMLLEGPGREATCIAFLVRVISRVDSEVKIYWWDTVRGYFLCKS